MFKPGYIHLPTFLLLPLLSLPLLAQEQPRQGPASASFWDGIPTSAPAEAERGDIFWVHERDDAPSGARGWNMIYVSEGANGNLEYVSGEIYVPDNSGDAELPMIIWAVGTPGFQDSCAPSRTGLYPAPDESSRVLAIEALLERGYAVVMSDYQGLGTPGPMAYLQGELQAKASLDAARAAVKFPAANVGTRIAAHGFSQGGQTVLWIGHIAGEYAPEFEVVGLAPVAPAARHLELSIYDLGIPVNGGYFISRMAGLQVGHPELRLRDILTEAGLELLTAQAWGCYEIFEAAVQLEEPYAHPEALQEGTQWRAWLEENDAFLPIPADIPFYLFQGDADVDVPVELTREVMRDMCAQGNSISYVEVGGADHFSILAPAAESIPDWMDDRFAGFAGDSDC